jgi:hypothetical protein
MKGSFNMNLILLTIAMVSTVSYAAAPPLGRGAAVIAAKIPAAACTADSGKGEVFGCSSTRRAYLLAVSDGSSPKSSNIGVATGVQLKPSGPVEVDTPGAVISGLDVTGYILVNASNVTVRNVRVNAGTWGGIITTAKGSDVLIEDCEVFSTWMKGSTKGVLFDGNSGGVIRRCNIHNVEDGIYLQGTHFVIEDNYVHDSEAHGEDPHTDSFQISAGTSNVVVRGNNFVYGDNDNSSFTVGNNEGPVDNIRLENNIFAGGGYTVRCDGRGPYPITNIAIIGNRIAKGVYGYTSFDGLCVPAFEKNSNLANGVLLTPSN